MNLTGLNRGNVSSKEIILSSEWSKNWRGIELVTGFILHSYNSLHYINHCRTLGILSPLVFTSRCFVAASKGGRSPSSGFPNYSMPSLPASNSNRLQWLNRGSPLTHSLTQGYFTTGSLPPISSSWRQAPWDSGPEIFFNWALAVLVLMWHPLWWEDGCVPYEHAWPSSSVRIALIACYWEFFHLHYIQVLYQCRLWKADHAYLTYLMLQRHLSHLNGRKIGHRQV
jgi:hypothetical protein